MSRCDLYADQGHRQAFKKWATEPSERPRARATPSRHTRVSTMFGRISVSQSVESFQPCVRAKTRRISKTSSPQWRGNLGHPALVHLTIAGHKLNTGNPPDIFRGNIPVRCEIRPSSLSVSGALLSTPHAGQTTAFLPNQSSDLIFHPAFWPYRGRSSVATLRKNVQPVANIFKRSRRPILSAESFH